MSYHRDPYPTTHYIVQPVIYFLRHLIGLIIFWGTLVAWKTIWSSMLGARNVSKLEVEKEDGSNPSIYWCVRLDVQIIYHTFDVFCIDFNYEVAYANNPDLHGFEHLKQTIELNLHLRIPWFESCPSDRTETRRSSLSIVTELGKDPPTGYEGWVNSQNNFIWWWVVDGPDSWQLDDSCFEEMHGSLLSITPYKLCILSCEHIERLGNCCIVIDPILNCSCSA